MKKLIITIQILIVVQLGAQNNSSFKDKKYSINIESSFNKITSDLNFRSVALNNVISTNYYFTNKMYGGVYFSMLTDLSKKEKFYLVGEKIIDITSTQFISYGFQFGYQVYQEDKVKIVPEIRLGYGSLNTKSISNNLDLKYDLITLIPKINFEYSLLSNIDIGMTSGFIFPFAIQNNQNIQNYNLNNIQTGLFLKWGL